MSEATERLARAAQQALGELDRFKVAYAFHLERDVEPPSRVIIAELEDALAAVRPAPTEEANEPMD